MQIQCFESITQKYPQFPTALLANEDLYRTETFYLIRHKVGHN